VLRTSSVNSHCCYCCWRWWWWWWESVWRHCSSSWASLAHQHGLMFNDKASILAIVLETTQCIIVRVYLYRSMTVRCILILLICCCNRMKTIMGTVQNIVSECSMSVSERVNKTRLEWRECHKSVEESVASLHSRPTSHSNCDITQSPILLFDRCSYVSEVLW